MSSEAACACGTCASCGGAAAVSRAAVGDAHHFRQAAIRQRMMRSIAGTRIDHGRPLAGLTTRGADDPAIALIDAHAASLHILAWYSARLAADGSILSGQDRDALARLTGLVGYVPRPALSATTTLAFTVDTMAGSPEKVRVVKGSKVASVPGQDEMPQIFETDAELTAVGAWNALRPHQARAPVTTDTDTLCLEGVGSAAAIGDLVAAPLTATGQVRWRVGRIAALERISDPSVDGAPFTCLHLAQLRTISGSPAAAQAYAGRVVILGQAASPFGATAPDIRAMTDEIKCAFGDVGASGGETAEELHRMCNPGAVTEWANFFVGTGGSFGSKKGAETRKLDLDAVYPGAVAGRVCIFTPPRIARTEEVPIEETLARIDYVEERARSDFLISAKVSQITLDKIELDPAAGNSFAWFVRSLAINIETEVQRLYRPPVDAALPGTADRLEIEGAALLPVGRRVVLTGQRWMNEAGREGEIVSEVATIAEATISNGRTMLRFERPVKMRFRSTTLRLLGNCIGASHGETPVQGAEIIGSGDAGRRNQRFALKGKPLSHVPAATARGYAPAIEARVDGRRWHHVATLAGHGSDDHAFTLRTDGEGASVLQFGGSLPSGLHNVTALYRTGAGRAGNLAAGRLTMAMAPVAGISKIDNPVLSEGGSDPEAIDVLRHAAPQSVRTLDRVVSLSDHAAFAAAYRGVGKALATELYQGMRSFVCLTIATSDLASPAPDSDIVTGLADELKRVTVPGRQVRIEGFDLIHPTIAIALATDPDLVRADVETAARATLAERFGADRRPFGRGLHRSEILAAVQAVPGVEAAQIRAFTLGTGHPAESEGRLLCPAPSIDPDTGALLRAGLLALDPARLAFEELVL